MGQWLNTPKASVQGRLWWVCLLYICTAQTPPFPGTTGPALERASTSSVHSRPIITTDILVSEPTIHSCCPRAHQYHRHHHNPTHLPWTSNTPALSRNGQDPRTVLQLSCQLKPCSGYTRAHVSGTIRVKMRSHDSGATTRQVPARCRWVDCPAVQGQPGRPEPPPQSTTPLPPSHPLATRSVK